MYLPHLDYNLQRLGPNDPAMAKDVRELDECIGDLRKCAEELVHSGGRRSAPRRVTSPLGEPLVALFAKHWPLF